MQIQRNSLEGHAVAEYVVIVAYPVQLTPAISFGEGTLVIANTDKSQLACSASPLASSTAPAMTALRMVAAAVKVERTPFHHHLLT